MRYSRNNAFTLENIQMNKITYKRRLNKKFFSVCRSSSIQDYYQTKYYTYVSSGRGALEFIFRAFKFNKGDIILAPAFIPEGIKKPINRCELRVEFYHSNHHLQPDFQEISDLLNLYEVKALILIHYFGIPQNNIHKIQNLLVNKNIIMIEDCAQGLFSQYADGSPIGKHGDFAIFSFTKSLPSIDGAMILVNNEKYYPLSLVYNKSILHLISVLSMFFHLKTQSLIAKNNFKLLDLLLSNSSKVFSIIYYYMMNNQKNPTNLTNYSKNILNCFDIYNFINYRSLYIGRITQLLKTLGIPHIPIPQNAITTGVPILVKNKKQILNYFSDNNVDVLSYTSKWFIPLNSKSYFIEKHFYDHHILLPVSENITNADFELYINIIKNAPFIH